MRGHVRQRSAGSWEVSYELPRGPDGKRRQRSMTLKGTRKQAERKLNEILHAIDTGAHVEPAKEHLADYLEYWLTTYAKPNLSPTTCEAYRKNVRKNIAPLLGSILLKDLKLLHVQQAYATWQGEGWGRKGKGLSAKTIMNLHLLLHQSLEQAVEWELIPRNPIRKAKPPKQKRYEITVFAEEHISLLMAEARGHYLYVPIVIGLTTGLRRGEILGLRWKDVNMETGVLTVAQALVEANGEVFIGDLKTEKSFRSLPLPSLTVQTLVRHKERQDEERCLMGVAYRDQSLIIARGDGTPIRPGCFTQSFADLARRIGLPSTRFHDLRHSHASMLVQEGAHPKVVSERLGHSGIGITTDRYCHLLPGLQEEAARRIDATLRKVVGE